MLTRDKILNFLTSHARREPNFAAKGHTVAELWWLVKPQNITQSSEALRAQLEVMVSRGDLVRERVLADGTPSRWKVVYSFNPKRWGFAEGATEAAVEKAPEAAVEKAPEKAPEAAPEGVAKRVSRAPSGSELRAMFMQFRSELKQLGITEAHFNADGTVSYEYRVVTTYRVDL